MAADDLSGLTFNLSGPVIEGHWAGRFRRWRHDFYPAQVRAVAGLLDELPVSLDPLFRGLFVPHSAELDQGVSDGQQVSGEPVMPLPIEKKVQGLQILLEDEV